MIRSKHACVAEETGVLDLEFVFTSGAEGDHGWLGYVKTMLLSIERVAKTGWKPKYNSEQAVRLAVKAILKER